MFTQSGIMCDVCGNHVFGLLSDDTITFFHLGGIEQELTAHTRNCVDLMKMVAETEDITLLSVDSPIRKAYEKAMEEAKVGETTS